MKKLVKRGGDLFKDGMSGGWTYKEIVGDGLTSDPVLIPSSGRGTTNGSVMLVCGANTGKVQVTIDNDDDIGNNVADWIDWDKGEVTGTVLDVFAGAISGIRAVSISGSIEFKLLM